MNIPFTKMQGLGNDFMVVETLRKPLEITPTIIRKMADRHFGVGFDQLLLIGPARQPRVDFEYRIFNADGNEVNQCGNGARCVGRFLWEARLTNKLTLLLGTHDRTLEVALQDDNQIKVNMGEPLFIPDQIPFIAEKHADSYTIQVNNKDYQIAVVNLGNPHAVLRVADVNQAPVEAVGSVLERHERFPQHVNVGFMQWINRQQIRLRVYERGVGETLACGSGACAAVVIGQMQGDLDREVEVGLLGGKLKVSWEGNHQPVWMTGPAEIVYKGEWLRK